MMALISVLSFHLEFLSQSAFTCPSNKIPGQVRWLFIQQ